MNCVGNEAKQNIHISFQLKFLLNSKGLHLKDPIFSNSSKSLLKKFYIILKKKM